MHDYLNQLNDAQRKAVTNIKGPTLVIAGAGSGKTRVLTYRIAHLLANEVPPYKILALTFTNKAAKEMKERVAHIVGNNLALHLWMGTFHSIFARILRYESSALGYESNYTIYDTTDSKNLIKSIIKEKKLDEKTYKPGQILGRISRAKNNLITPATYQNNSAYYSTDKANMIPHTGEIYATYAKRCKITDAMDFDDLLLNTNILFRDHPSILKKYQEKFEYILVDEYQDTNFAQYLIIKKLVEIHHNICVVGDDAQSIYGFRGAKIENILNFQKDYPHLHTFKLEYNYRSTQNIVNAANSIIANNKKQLPKKVFTENIEGEKILVKKAITEIEEGHLIANNIQERSLQQQTAFKNFAILYRTNAQSRILEEALRKRNIPYRIYGGLSFYQRKEIKDLTAYLRFAINTNDDESLKRIINYPARGIGTTTMNKAEASAIQFGVPIWRVINNPAQFELNINGGTASKLKKFVVMINQFSTITKNNDAYDAAQEIASNSGILKNLYNDNSPEGKSRYENIQELLNGIKDFVATRFEEGESTELQAYIENISLLTDMDKNDDQNNNKVTLMTIHSAKGLEFPHLFISGLEEGLFPSSMSLETPEDIEEERRLFYVALTRAEKSVTLFWSQSRFKWGTPENKVPSRFLNELNEKYLDIEDQKLLKLSDPTSAGLHFRRQPQKVGFTQTHQPSGSFIKRAQGLSRSNTLKKPNTTPINPNFIPDAPEKINTGQTILHQRFGRGKVIQLEGDGQNKKATIEFASGRKTLLLRFAKLKII